jgi:hypothetical protein
VTNNRLNENIFKVLMVLFMHFLYVIRIIITIICVFYCVIPIRYLQEINQIALQVDI